MKDSLIAATDESSAYHHVLLHDGDSWYIMLYKFLGPRLVVSIAYVDPGNFSTDLSAGSHYRFSLIWALLLAHVAGFVFQTMVTVVSLATGRDLAHECRCEYPRPVVYCLWLLTELASISSDMSYIMGNAVRAICPLPSAAIAAGSSFCAADG